MSPDEPLPPPGTPMSSADIAVLKVLVRHSHHVVSRESLSRLAGLEADSPRRVDSCLVTIRRSLGPDSVVLVRQRGWMLSPEGAIAAQRFLAQIEQSR